MRDECVNLSFRFLCPRPFRIRTLWIMISFLDTRERRKIMAIRDLHIIYRRVFSERVTLNNPRVYASLRVFVFFFFFFSLNEFFTHFEFAAFSAKISSWSKRSARLLQLAKRRNHRYFFFFFFHLLHLFLSSIFFLNTVQYLYNISSRFSCRTEFLIWNTRRYLDT